MASYEVKTIRGDVHSHERYDAASLFCPQVASRINVHSHERYDAAKAAVLGAAIRKLLPPEFFYNLYSFLPKAQKRPGRKDNVPCTGRSGCSLRFFSSFPAPGA